MNDPYPFSFSEEEAFHGDELRAEERGESQRALEAITQPLPELGIEPTLIRQLRRLTANAEALPAQFSEWWVTEGSDQAARLSPRALARTAFFAGSSAELRNQTEHTT